MLNKIQSKIAEIEKHEKETKEFGDLRQTLKVKLQERIESDMAIREITANKIKAKKDVAELDMNDKQNIIRLWKMNYSLPQLVYCVLIGNFNTQTFKMVDMSLHKNLANRINDVILQYRELPINLQRCSHPEEILE